MSKPHRFPIRFDRWYAALSTALFLPPSSAYVEVNDEQVSVRMGWAFRARFPRGEVASVVEMRDTALSRGVHGFAGRWLVNGSGQGIVTIELTPHQRGYVMGLPVRLQQLMVSVNEPAVMVALIANGNTRNPRGSRAEAERR